MGESQLHANPAPPHRTALPLSPPPPPLPPALWTPFPRSLALPQLSPGSLEGRPRGVGAQTKAARCLPGCGDTAGHGKGNISLSEDRGYWGGTGQRGDIGQRGAQGTRRGAGEGMPHPCLCRALQARHPVGTAPSFAHLQKGHPREWPQKWRSFSSLRTGGQEEREA